MRRRLDDEPRIDFPRESEVADLLASTPRRSIAIVGVMRTMATPPTELAGVRLPAEDSSLDVSGLMPIWSLIVQLPRPAQDIINCSSTRVPPERQWQDLE